MEGDEKMEGDMKRKKSKRGRGRRWKKKRCGWSYKERKTHKKL